MSDYTYYLWKPRVDVNETRYLAIDDLPNSGFASVYAVTQADARSIQTLGSYSDYKGTVWRPTLAIDCDSPEASNAVEGRLREKGLGYKKYFSGNRGCHFEVARAAAPSHKLPAIDKAWVERELPEADPSLYKHCALFRQPGAIHQKTGKRKELVAEVPGEVLDLRDERPTESARLAVDHRDGTIQSVFTDPILQRMTVPIGRGERHKRFIEVAVRLDTLNQPAEWALGYMENLNLISEEPLSSEELRRMLEWAYFQRNK